LTEHVDRAGAGCDQAEGQANDGGFSRAVGSEEPDGLTGRQTERDIGQADLTALIDLGDAFELDDIAHGSVVVEEAAAGTVLEAGETATGTQQLWEWFSSIG
jgi:hypothetical protein